MSFLGNLSFKEMPSSRTGEEGSMGCRPRVGVSVLSRVCSLLARNQDVFGGNSTSKRCHQEEGKNLESKIKKVEWRWVLVAV